MLRGIREPCTRPLCLVCKLSALERATATLGQGHTACALPALAPVVDALCIDTKLHRDATETMMLVLSHLSSMGVFSAA